MIKKEYEVWIELGGNFTYTDLINDVYDDIKDCNSFKSLPLEFSPVDREILLTKVALNNLSQDYADTIRSLILLKKVLNDGNFEKALRLADQMFRD